MFIYCTACQKRHNFKEHQVVRLLHFAQLTAFAPPHEEPHCLRAILRFTYDGARTGILVDRLFEMQAKSMRSNTEAR